MSPHESADFRVISFSQAGHGSERLYQRKKAHRKSRAGCFACKTKRVKCDESRPSCSRCKKSGSQCQYGGASPSEPGSSSPASLCTSLSPSPSSSVYGFDIDGISGSGTSRLVLLQHFHRAFPVLEMNIDCNIEPILSLGVRRPYLLDAVMAVSACHLRSHTADASHRVAEHAQKAAALETFQKALSGPLDTQTADALILTAMFMNLLSFATSPEDDGTVGSSWVYSTRPDRLGWFSLALGMKPLLMATTPFREGSILDWMLEETDPLWSVFNGDCDRSLDKVPDHWLWLGGVRRDATPPDEDDDGYFETLRILAETNVLEPRPEYFFYYVNVVRTLNVAFRAELEARRPRAVWIIGYWIGLMCRYDFWWMRTTARRDHRAACTWLQSLHLQRRPDGAMWAKLLDDLMDVPKWTDAIVTEVV